jgi:hypothetical protein
MYSIGRKRPYFFSYEECFKNLLNTKEEQGNINLTISMDGEDPTNFIQTYKDKYSLLQINKNSSLESLRVLLEHIRDQSICPDDLIYLVEYILFSAPLNWRIHGPVPDCWRFTEFGWKVLLKDFDIIEIDRLETPDRPLFPIKYNILAKCNKSKNISIDSVKFERI